MEFDFSPNLEPDEIEEEKKEVIKVEPNSIVIETNRENKDLLSMGGLLGLTKSHIEEDFKCRNIIDDITQSIEDNKHLMSVKDLIEYLKVKLREREFHTESIFKAYAIMQRTDMAKEIIAGSSKKERIIEATDKSKLNFLLSKLNPHTKEEND